MTNIIALNVPLRREALTDQSAALIDAFGRHRRHTDDVFWLKENAELLNILECTGAQVSQQVLSGHGQVYHELPERISFFPQYYRFLLSICLDLEDLGIGGQQGEKLCAWVAEQGLAEAELSDLQRAEAFRLLARRGVQPVCDAGLNARLHKFIERSDTFALPNKKAAYELTHIVFYLSEYGRKDPELSARAIRSLNFAGVLAYLDQNADLLAEICVALRYAGAQPSAIWETWVMSVMSAFEVVEGADIDVADDYHAYFVSGWLARLKGQIVTTKELSGGRVKFNAPSVAFGPLA